MQTLPDLVARDRRSERPALRTADREMDYRRFCTTAWKASNYLRHLGVGGGRGVAVLSGHNQPPLLTFLGAALLDTPTSFADSTASLPSAIKAVDARAVLVPEACEGDVEPPAGTTLAVYGGEPDQPTTENWEEGVWSENPAFVPSTATADSIALVTADTPTETIRHGALLGAAKALASDLGLEQADTVAVDGSLADPRVVAAVLAPLTVGGCVVLGEAGEASVTVDPAYLETLSLGAEESAGD